MQFINILGLAAMLSAAAAIPTAESTKPLGSISKRATGGV
jgi:hypothetical protein